MTTEAVLAAQLKALHNDVSDIKGALGKLTEAITKLALIEDRQIRSGEALDRAFGSINKLSDRVAAVEQLLPTLSNQTNMYSAWIDRAVWGLISGSAVYMLKAAGIL